MERLPFSKPSDLTKAHVRYQLSVPALCEEAILRQEGVLSVDGSLVVRTGECTGRSPRDKFLVAEPATADAIWWGAVNQPFEPEQFDALQERVLQTLEQRDIFVQDCFVGAHPEHRLGVRVITQLAWHSLFARHMFIQPREQQLEDFTPDFTLIAFPSFQANPARDGTRSGVFIVINLARRLILIGGTAYAGEIKKAMFTVMNYWLPTRGVLPMHCSANIGPQGDVTLFFGLSGTGKTTLSADPERALIGDDEHGWCEDGIFNLEGGCYAKVIRLSPTAEPAIYAAVHRFGSVLENVVIDHTTRQLDFHNDLYTENTRAAYPLHHVPNADRHGRAGHPERIIFLTADAFGVMPPVARLTHAQAMYHFLSGYTARVAGTERGVNQPVATFSACFSAPFLVHQPQVYAQMFGERLARHNVAVWLVNTGWNGRGERLRIAWTRAMVSAILSGRLDAVPFRQEPIFGLEVPLHCPGAPKDVLFPERSWDSTEAYQQRAKQLAQMFRQNFAAFAAHVTPEVCQAGPRV
ncbi:MAG: phosphoenolpyruvate carboxykinase (ATP) [Thermoflexales bacterium]